MYLTLKFGFHNGFGVIPVEFCQVDHELFENLVHAGVFGIFELFFDWNTSFINDDEDLPKKIKLIIIYLITEEVPQMAWPFL